MTERNKWSNRFAEALDIYGHQSHDCIPSHVIRYWLIDALEPAQRTTYYFIEIQFSNKPVTAADVSYAYHYKINYASTLLKSLYDLGLLTREQVTDEQSKRYVYSRKG